MSDNAFVRQEIVDNIVFDITDIRCPKCHNNTLVLSGQALVPQKDIMEAGVITASLPGTYEQGSFELENIDCMVCNVRFIIKDHELFQLEKENQDLKHELSRKKGKPVPGQGFMH